MAENQAYVLVTKLKTATEGGTDEVVWEAMNVSNSACALQPTTKMRSQGLHASELHALVKQVQALADREFAAFATQTAQNSRPPEEGKRKPNKKRHIFTSCGYCLQTIVSLLQVISDVHADLPCSTCSKTFATTTKRDAHAKKCNTADDKSEEEPDKKPGRFPASCGNCEDFSCAGNLLPEIRPASCVTTCSPPKALGTTRSVAGVLRLNCHHC